MEKEAIENAPDYQKIEREIGLMMGESISDKILPWIISSKQTVKFLNDAITGLNQKVSGLESDLKFDEITIQDQRDHLVRLRRIVNLAETLLISIRTLDRAKWPWLSGGVKQSPWWTTMCGQARDMQTYIVAEQVDAAIKQRAK